ncbi:hypothetical protein ACWPOB_18335 [Rhodococcus sp. 2H158]
MDSRRYRFLGHYPFAELGLLGWRLAQLGRSRAADFVRTALVVDGHERALGASMSTAAGGCAITPPTPSAR